MEIEVWSQEISGKESRATHAFRKGEIDPEAEGGPSTSMLRKSAATPGLREGGAHSVGTGESLATTPLF